MLVVGAGGVGRWFATAVDAPVAFADVDSGTARAAAGETDGRAVAIDTEERFTAVCLAVPMSAVGEAIASHADRAEAAMLDCTGVMAQPLAAMRAHAATLERVSLHPLFAPEHAPGRIATVRDADGPVTEGILADLREEHELFETTATEHDDAMATVQARAHVAVLAYALAAEDVPEPFHTPVSETLTDLVERITGGEPRVYAEIQAAVGGGGDVADAARRLADADPETFEDLYRAAER